MNGSTGVENVVLKPEKKKDNSLMVFSAPLHHLPWLATQQSPTFTCLFVCIFFYLLVLFKHDKAAQNQSDRTEDWQREADSPMGAKLRWRPGEDM